MDPQKYALVNPMSLQPNPSDKRDRNTSAHCEGNPGLSPLMVTPLKSDPHDEARRRFAQYAVHHSSFAEVMVQLYESCSRQNERHFEAKLKEPHLTLGRTAPRSLALCKVLTDWGGRLQITVNEALVWGTSRLLRQPWPAEGTRRFVQDLLLHEQVHQFLFEVLGVREDGYRGHGPRFAEMCNRIGAELGLRPVGVRHRGQKDRDQPLCNQWPVCVRPPEYYLGHVVLPGWERQLAELGLLSAEEVDEGLRPERPPVRSLAGFMELCEFLLETSQGEKLWRILHREIGRTQPATARGRRAFEDGREDSTGRPLPRTEIRPEWLAWNNGCVPKMAEAICQKQAFDNMPFLADALEAAGCIDEGVLNHCRAWVRHTRQCWVLKRLLDPGTEGALKPSDIVPSPSMTATASALTRLASVEGARWLEGTLLP